MQDKSTDSKQLIQGYLAVFATLAMWACFSLVSRLAGKSDLTYFDTIALRLITASAFLLPYALFKRLFIPALKDWRLWALAIVGNLIYSLFVYRGFKSAPAAHGAILLAGIQPFLISAIIWFIDKRVPNRPRAIGLCLIATGIACTATPYFSGGSTQSLIGDGLILVGSISWAFYSVFAARWGYSAATLTTAVALCSAAFYLPVYFVWLPKNLAFVPISTILTQCFFQGIVATILAMLTYVKAVSTLGAERPAAILALVPIVTGLVAVPLLGEALTVWLLIGLVLVSAGSFIAAKFGSAGLRKA